MSPTKLPEHVSRVRCTHCHCAVPTSFSVVFKAEIGRKILGIEADHILLSSYPFILGCPPLVGPEAFLYCKGCQRKRPVEAFLQFLPGN